MAYTKIFTSEEDELLIEMVAQHPLLYNAALPEYRNGYKRDKVWDEIAKALNRVGIIGEARECKTRWKNIKDTYFRQKRKSKNGTGYASPHPRSKFEHYRRILSFLESVDDGIQEEENPKSPPKSSGHQDSQSQSDMVITVDPTDMVPSPEPSDSPSEQIITDTHPDDFDQEESTGAPLRSAPKRARVYRKKQDDVIRYVVRNREIQRPKMIRTSMQTKNSSGEEDEIDLFTRQANSVLKKLPTYYQIKAMHELFNVLTKYKMLTVTNPSGIHGPTSSTVVAETQLENAPIILMAQSTAVDSLDDAGTSLPSPNITIKAEYSPPSTPQENKADDLNYNSNN